MRVAVVVLLFVAVAAGFQEVQLGYHEAVGIPAAARIKEAEDQILSRSNDRIVGGAIAPVNAHPYLGGLVISLVGVVGNSACGSSLLTANRLVTAAHCWNDGRFQAWQFVVVLGSQFLFSGGTRIATSSVIMHPQWTPSNLRNDVAIIYLPTSVFFSASIQPVALPNGNDLFNTFAGLWGTAAGYGKTSDAQVGVSVNTMISQVNLQVITVAVCTASYGPVFVQPSTLCTSGFGGVGICGGDSGGPLVINRNGVVTLVGISSFAANNACQGSHPSGFARVTSFMNFIQQHLF